MELKNVLLVFCACLWKQFTMAAPKQPSSSLASSPDIEVVNDDLPRVKKEARIDDNDEWEAARYAGHFAKMLTSLEKNNKDIYVDFISSGFTNSVIPRKLPRPLQILSRTIPQQALPSSRVLGEVRRPRILGEIRQPRIISQRQRLRRPIPRTPVILQAQSRPVSFQPSFVFPRERIIPQGRGPHVVIPTVFKPKATGFRF